MVEFEPCNIACICDTIFEIALCSFFFMQSCSYKYICCCSVGAALMFRRPSKSQYTRTKLRNPSVMISSIADNCIPANVFPQHTQVISTNRLCYFWCSHTILITHLFVVYHTHLVMSNSLCSAISVHTVYPSEMYAVLRTRM